MNDLSSVAVVKLDILSVSRIVIVSCRVPYMFDPFNTVVFMGRIILGLQLYL